jgi:hypothetical protein
MNCSPAGLGVLVITLVVTLLPGQGVAGRPDDCKQSTLCSFVRDGGWPLPRYKAKDVLVRTTRQPVPHADYKDFEAAILDAQSDIRTTITLFNLDKGRLEIREETVLIKRIWEFYYKGKPYAYGFRLARMNAETGVEAGAVYDLMYTDRDRNGTYEEINMCGPGFMPPVPKS